MFIELIDNKDDNAVMINLNNVDTIKPHGMNTKLTFSVGFIIVRECYDVVIELINEKTRRK